MKNPTVLFKRRLSKRMRILEMIEASQKLSEKKRHHPLESGCGCISCVNRRKRIVKGHEKNWKFRI